MYLTLMPFQWQISEERYSLVQAFINFQTSTESNHLFLLCSKCKKKVPVTASPLPHQNCHFPEPSLVQVLPWTLQFFHPSRVSCYPSSTISSFSFPTNTSFIHITQSIQFYHFNHNLLSWVSLEPSIEFQQKNQISLWNNINMLIFVKTNSSVKEDKFIFFFYPLSMPLSLLQKSFSKTCINPQWEHFDVV